MLVRKRGVGTQVVQTPVHRRVELTSLFDDLARAGQEPATELLDYHDRPGTDEIADAPQSASRQRGASPCTGCAAPTASRWR